MTCINWIAVSLAVLTFGLMGTAKQARAQKTAASPVSTAETPAPRMKVAFYEPAGHAEHPDARYDTWFLEGAVPQKITAELWRLENNRVTRLRTLTVANRFAAWVADEKVPFNERYRGDISLLRHGATKTDAEGVTLPLPDMSIPYSRWQGGESTKGYYFRDNNPPTLTLPNDIANTVVVKETHSESSFSPNQPFALWIGQAPTKNALGETAPNPLTQSLLQTANNAAANAPDNANALLALFGVLNSANKGDVLLVMTVTWEALRAKIPLPVAPVAPPAPFLQIQQYDQKLLEPYTTNFWNKLNTWFMRSLGAGTVEARVWYIAEGKATVRDQRILQWNNKPQEGTWQLQMLEHTVFTVPDSLMFASYTLNTVFDDAHDAPRSKPTGSATEDARKLARMPSGVGTVYTIVSGGSNELIPNQPVIVYGAQSVKTPTKPNIFQQLRRDAQPVETLTKQSITTGSAFLVLTVLWKPTKGDAPKPSATR